MQESDDMGGAGDIFVLKNLRNLKRDVVLVTILFLVAFGIRLYFLQFFRVISADGTSYATIARAFIRGEGLGGSIHFPPFYPILVGLMNLVVPDIELSGRLVSMIMGSLIVVPVYLLGIEFFNRRAGVLAALLAISWPSLRSWSGEVMSQATYVTLALLGAYLFWRAYRSGSVVLSAAAGVVAACSYLTRPEGFILAAAVTPFLVAGVVLSGVPKRQIALLAVIGWAAFFCVAFPYLSLLHAETGKWQLSGKTSATLADSLSEYLGRPDLKREPGFQGLGYRDVIRSYPDFLRGNVIANIRKLWNESLPPYLWLLALAGFLAGKWGKEEILRRLFLVATFAPLLIIIVFFFIGPEYTQPYLPILFLWISQGILVGEAAILKLFRIRKREGRAAEAWRAAPAFVAVLLFSSISVARQVPADFNSAYDFTQDGGRYDHKRIGQLLEKNLPKDAVIMTRSGRIGFYSDRKYVDVPQAGLEEIIATARKNNVRYLVVDGLLLWQRPQLGILLRPLQEGNPQVLYLGGETGDEILPGIKLFLLYKEPSSLGVAVYRVE
jgi:4-amino-4-deoxy-L-arabinose transferase-like glycosyltransferase